MSVEVSGKNVEVSRYLRRSAETKVSRLGKYLGGVEFAQVRFKEERNPRIAEKDSCHLVVMGPHRSVEATASGTDVLSALDRATHKAVHRLEKVRTG